jgi:hypothetical protein
MKKTTIALIVILILVLISLALPKPYSLHTKIKSCVDSKIVSLAYINQDSGWCAGIIYPSSKEELWQNPTCTMLIKGWDCFGYKIFKKMSFAL